MEQLSLAESLWEAGLDKCLYGPKRCPYRPCTAAKARGVRFGRQRIEQPPEAERVILTYFLGGITADVAAKRLGVSASTFYRWAKEGKA